VDAADLGTLFRRVAADRREAPALVESNRSWSYRQLDECSELLAARLLEGGLTRGSFVGVVADRSPAAVIAILGVLKAGAAYVPLDPSYPADRLAFVVADAGLEYAVGTAGSAAMLPSSLRLIDVPVEASGGRTPDPVGLRVQPDDPAYVIYTSGSTGTPNGCLISHANVLALLRGALPLFAFDTGDRWSLFHSASFDFAVWELWGAFTTGGCTVAVPAEAARSPEDLLELLVEQRVTVLNQVPSVFGYLSRVLSDRPGADLALRYVIFGGEGVRLADVRQCRSALADSATPEFVNMYGITETTVHVTYKLIDEAALSDGAASPIGRPLPHLEISLRTPDGHPAPPGEPGEIWVSGAAVGAGYLNRPELTGRRFVEIDGVRHYRSGDLARQLASGEYDYAGRIDHQVKVRGFRIELGEVEAALADCPGVRTAAATVVATGPNSTASLVALVVPEGEADPALARVVRGHLAAKLPPQSVPDRIRLCPALPLTASGKIDRSALPALAMPRPA